MSDVKIAIIALLVLQIFFVILFTVIMDHLRSLILRVDEACAKRLKALENK